ncbi:hypothetical protein MUK42_34498 [Musa troglodytarum]|uniref:Uncharacterized protein n=1 Tax=Musa troglodytarum TaxID=320322 RepID=A0A9E7EG36_9LILI|nr:hypothetical protein MUK42_34498 [Musa troglodytarum]
MQHLSCHSSNMDTNSSTHPWEIVAWLVCPEDSKASSLEEEHGMRKTASEILEISILSSILSFSLFVPRPSPLKSPPRRGPNSIYSARISPCPPPFLLSCPASSLDLAGNRRFGSLGRRRLFIQNLQFDPRSLI